MLNNINILDIQKANQIIAPYIHKTPIIKSDSLNHMLGHEIYFKAESLEKTGAFKIRGVLNCFLQEREKKEINKIVCYSSGNHAQAVAHVAGEVGKINAEIYMDKSCSPLKQNSVKKHGANLILTETRIQADQLSHEAGSKDGVLCIPPSDNDLVIAGAATLAYEAIEQADIDFDAIFAPIGGGGLVSGTLISTKHLLPSCLVIGAEPEIANDAYLSKKLGHIHRFPNSPNTIADGLRTLALSPRTFEYIKRIDDIIISNEEEIIYWAAWLNHLLKFLCEPSSAVAMSAAYKWLSKQHTAKKILITISGGNIDQETLNIMWQKDRLSIPPENLS